MRPQSAKEAATTRDALAKGDMRHPPRPRGAPRPGRCCCGAGVYVALFHWLVTKLNRTTGAPHAAGGPALRTVSILDIYGFEVGTTHEK